MKVYLTDKDKILLPGRQIQGTINGGTRQGLWLPVTAVVDLGQRRSVFVFDGNKFIATRVRTGIRSGDKIEILDGIGQNSLVAEKALLLTDSDGFISMK